MSESRENWTLDGKTLTVTHLDQQYWPDEGLSKRDVLDYYRSMAAVMLPYFRNRPVTLRLFPRGIKGPSYYRRDLPDEVPEWLPHVDYMTETNPHRVQLPLANDAASLIWLANLGAIEFHLWASSSTHLQQPDWAVFDLDPGEKASFGQVLRAALMVRGHIEQEGWHGYPKTSGASGLHVYAPLPSGQAYDTVRERIKSIADELAIDHPDLFAAPRGKTHEGGRVTVDYLQNSIGHNTAAPYTLRALPGAPVSTPVSWDEVEKGKIRPADFTLKTVPARVRRHGDLFAPVLEPGGES